MGYSDTRIYPKGTTMHSFIAIELKFRTDMIRDLNEALTDPTIDQDRFEGLVKTLKMHTAILEGLATASRKIDNM